MIKNLPDRTSAEFTEYLYDRIWELKSGEEVQNYVCDTENRLIVVWDDRGLLMVALYDGYGSWVFNRRQDGGYKRLPVLCRKESVSKDQYTGKGRLYLLVWLR